MKKEIKYKAFNISSFPYELDNHKFSINGLIEAFTGDSLVIYSPDLNNIPDHEYHTNTEDEAHETFIKYAKKFIDEKF